MPNPFKSVAAKILGGAIVLVALLGVAGWRLMQPKIKIASVAEVRAVLPKELLETLPPDPAANERYKKLVDLISTVDQKELGTFVDTKSIKQPVATIYASARAFWAAHPSLCNDIMAILSAGPVQWKRAPNSNPINSGDDFKPLSKFKGFIKSVTTSARLYADDKQFDTSTKLYVMAITLSDRLIDDGGPLICYLVGVALEAIVNKSLDEAMLGGGFSGANCCQLLAAMGPSPRVDNYLAVALRTDFQEFALLLIPDPTKTLRDLLGNMTPETSTTGSGDDEEAKKEEPISGTYDAIETAKLYAKLCTAAMANARSTFSKQDKSVFDALDKDAKTLPIQAESASKEGMEATWNKWKYRFAMDNGHNTIGRILASNGLVGSEAARASCRWRALRDATRVALASSLYRSSHGGKLPPAADGFLTYLGAWPQDPYNGNPMIYSASNEVVYAVGENLVDDGGTLSPEVNKSPDIGLSLKR